jgi:formyltetrahydrofolate deformylase
VRSSSNRGPGKPPPNEHARLLISGPNASGLVASFSQLLYTHSCDIIDCASESSSMDDVENEHKMFFQRILFDYRNLNNEREEVEREILRICQKFGMGYRLVSPLILFCNFVTYYNA